MVVDGQMNEGVAWGEPGQPALQTKVLIGIGFK